jgi:hypothetical protein
MEVGAECEMETDERQKSITTKSYQTFKWKIPIYDETNQLLLLNDFHTAES